jgi:hypothetical protein
MRKIHLVTASILAMTLIAGVSATRVFAQGGTIDKTTYLTFSGPVQVPGATLPAGKYLFRIANPASPSLWQVFDASGRHLVTSFFFVPTRERTISEVNKADGKPVVRFHETVQGVPPAVRILYYPTDLSGSVFMYPKAQAQRIAAAAHQPVLALDENAAPGEVARAITVEPPTTDAAASK